MRKREMELACWRVGEDVGWASEIWRRKGSTYIVAGEGEA